MAHEGMLEGKCKLKPRCEWLKTKTNKTLTVPNVGVQSGAATVENLAVSNKVNIHLLYYQVVFTSRYLLRMKTSLYKNLHTNVYCGLIHNGPKLATTQMPFSW